MTFLRGWPSDDVVAISQTPLRLARCLRSVNSVLYLIRAALTSSKQTLYRISAARISLDTISNGRLAFMKMTGDAGPPERILVYTYRKPVNGSYRTGGEKRRVPRAPRSMVVVVVVLNSGGVVVESSSGVSHQRDLVGKWLTSWNTMVPPTGMQWAGVCGRFTSFDKGDIQWRRHEFDQAHRWPLRSHDWLSARYNANQTTV